MPLFKENRRLSSDGPRLRHVWPETTVNHFAPGVCFSLAAWSATWVGGDTDVAPAVHTGKRGHRYKDSVNLHDKGEREKLTRQ